jgi:hypothetical protein
MLTGNLKHVEDPNPPQDLTTERNCSDHGLTTELLRKEGAVLLTSHIERETGIPR